MSLLSPGITSNELCAITEIERIIWKGGRLEGTVDSTHTRVDITVHTEVALIYHFFERPFVYDDDFPPLLEIESSSRLAVYFVYHASKNALSSANNTCDATEPKQEEQVPGSKLKLLSYKGHVT